MAAIARIAAAARIAIEEPFGWRGGIPRVALEVSLASTPRLIRDDAAGTSQ